VLEIFLEFDTMFGVDAVLAVLFSNNEILCQHCTLFGRAANTPSNVLFVWRT
jgi:hypothetical protein